MGKSYMKIEGMAALQKSLEKLGKVPQKHVTSASRKGMNIALKSARINAPVDTGYLKKGVVIKGERSREKGKKTYRIVFDRALNDVFQKPNKDGKITGYYPISQEYGFFARNGRYIPGFKFMHHALEGNTKQMEDAMVSEMKIKIDTEIAKVGLKR